MCSSHVTIGSITVINNNHIDKTLYHSQDFQDWFLFSDNLVVCVWI